MDLRRLGLGEWLAAASGVALLLSLFLPWYDFATPFHDARTGWTTYAPFGSFSGWEALSAIDVLLALVAASGVLLAIVTAVQGVPAVPVALSALISVFAAVGVVFVLIRVLFIPDWASGRAWGLWLGLAGSLGIVIGSFISMRDEIRPDAREPDLDLIPAPRP